MLYGQGKISSNLRLVTFHFSPTEEVTVQIYGNVGDLNMKLQERERMMNRGLH